MTYPVAENPQALREVAAIFRGEANVTPDMVQSLVRTMNGVTYVGPAGDRFRHAMHLIQQIVSLSYLGLAEAAVRLEQGANEAEVEIAARRAAGLC